MVANLTLLNSSKKTQIETGTKGLVQQDVRASVHPSALLGQGTRVGAFAVIGRDVVLGNNCIVHPHAVITGPTQMGDDNEVYPFACIGGAPQDLRHRGEATRLAIGNGNCFREHVTVGRGTVHGGSETRLGNDNLVMAYCHIAHDCQIGNNVVMANNATLAGHVQVQDFAVFGGMVAVASFVRIGESAMLAAGSMIERDVAPFAMVAGDRAVIKGVNRVGISRRGFSKEARIQIKQIIKLLKSTHDSLSHIIAEFAAFNNLSPEAGRLLLFLQQKERGLTR